MTDLRPASEIAENIHWLKDSYVNNYIVVNNDELILIDSGMNKRAKGIMKYIKQELSEMRIAKIYVTHHHMDHIGGLHHLHEHYHPRVFVGEEDASVVTGERIMPLPGAWYLKPIFYIIRPFISPKGVEAVELVSDGMMSDNMSVYHLPGHTMGSMGFLKESTMFSGDSAVTGDGRVNLGVKMFAESMTAAYSSMKKLATLDFNQILPGHGTPILEDADQLVKDAVSRLSID